MKILSLYYNQSGNILCLHSLRGKEGWKPTNFSPFFWLSPSFGSCLPLITARGLILYPVILLLPLLVGDPSSGTSSQKNPPLLLLKLILLAFLSLPKLQHKFTSLSWQIIEFSCTGLGCALSSCLKIRTTRELSNLSTGSCSDLATASTGLLLQPIEFDLAVFQFEQWYSFGSLLGMGLSCLCSDRRGVWVMIIGWGRYLLAWEEKYSGFGYFYSQLASLCLDRLRFRLAALLLRSGCWLPLWLSTGRENAQGCTYWLILQGTTQTSLRTVLKLPSSCSLAWEDANLRLMSFLMYLSASKRGSGLFSYYYQSGRGSSIDWNSSLRYFFIRSCNSRQETSWCTQSLRRPESSKRKRDCFECEGRPWLSCSVT